MYKSVDVDGVPSAMFHPAAEPDGEVLLPFGSAVSGWGSGRMRGMAVSGALARAAERAAAACGHADLQPMRWTVDLFRPASMAPCRTTTTVVRSGRRVCLIDATLIQNGVAVARGTALFARPGDSPQGRVWSGGTPQQLPPGDSPAGAERERLYYSPGVGWTPAQQEHHTDTPTRIWHYAVPVVHGERPTPFQFAAAVADVASLAANLGTEGLEFINADITLALARLPVALELGIAADTRVAAAGLATCTALLYDRDGTLGTATVSALATAAPAAVLPIHAAN
ncbi:acyl-CoA thioesterase domain-containing protein [Nocardia stercoris]|uniref:Thioesterase family protein n=1 Tax=Nocardia stercoris TaxID=2483361 RepID=A0A3M2KT08_9NOCA|nr:acyl-CoA thioesterase domain-containing protein [Nocardia stercoris]RMI28807.1 thioesterase family protein [Nocardia stercoris]